MLLNYISKPIMSYKPETLEGVLSRFPEQARLLTQALFDEHRFLFRITAPRRTRLGSFKGMRFGGRPVIQINSDLGQYSFLLVFLHELAHLVVNKKYGRKAKPHGEEWKNAYRNLVLPFFNEEVFPLILTTELHRYFIKAPATFHRDTRLINTLLSLEGGVEIVTVNDVPLNSTFTLMSGRQFVKLEKLRTRYKCFCPKTRKYYLVPRSAQVLQA
jgi:predicted SprT family Zn-dependent metalloprotease